MSRKSKLSPLDWFKFSPSKWYMGRIQKADPLTRCEFLSLCCVYWSAEGSLSLEDAQLEISNWPELMRLRVVKVQDQMISISFLDEQLADVQRIVSARSVAGKKGRQKQLGQLPDNSPASDQQKLNKNGQIRLDKIRVIKEGNFETTKNQILESVSQHEILARRHSLTTAQAKKYLSDFLLDQELSWDNDRTIKEIWSHANNWIRIQIEKSQSAKSKQPGLGDYIKLAAGGS